MNRKLVLLLIPIVVLLACCVCALLIVSEKPEAELYLENIKMADKYLGENNIEKAIIYYEKAIKNDETQEEPYIALALIYYENQDNIQEAISILQKGLENTNSDKIKNALAVYLEKQESQDKANKNNLNNSASQNDKQQLINFDLLSIFTDYSYEKYLTNYSIVSENYSNKVYSIRYSGINAEFLYYNTQQNNNIVNESTGKPNNESTPCEIKLDDVNDIINNASQGVTFDQIKKSGVYNAMISVDSPSNKKVVTFTYNNCTISIECDNDGNVIGSNIFNKIVPAQKAQAKGEITLTGKVIHKNSPKNVQNAKLVFRKGTDVHSGSSCAEVIATDGTYSLNLETDSYTVEVSAANYEIAYFNVTLTNDTSEVTQDFEISPKSTGEVIKVVVEWTGSTYVTSHSWCEDDNYIVGEIGHYEGYDGDVLYNSNGDLVADYSRGDSSDTTTFYPFENAKYEIHVHGDFTDPGVVVKVYLPGQASPVVITQPKSSFGYWIVCDIIDGQVVNVDGVVS